MYYMNLQLFFFLKRKRLISKIIPPPSVLNRNNEHLLRSFLASFSSSPFIQGNNTPPLHLKFTKSLPLNWKSSSNKMIRSNYSLFLWIIMDRREG